MGREKFLTKIYIDIEPEIIEHQQVLDQTELTHEQLVDVGILIGTDYNPGGFAGIGPKTALKLIREYGKLENIEKIKDLLSGYSISRNTRYLFKTRSSKCG